MPLVYSFFFIYIYINRRIQHSRSFSVRFSQGGSLDSIPSEKHEDIFSMKGLKADNFIRDCLLLV